jgi:hypothetical protein
MEIPCAVLRAALLFAASQDVRYYLNGVLLETNADGTEVMVVATNGKILFACPVNQDEKTPVDPQLPRQIILERQELISILKGGHFLRICGVDSEFNAARAYLTSESRVSSPANAVRKGLIGIINGRYPDWTRVVPSPLRAEQGTAIFDGEYLGIIKKAQVLLRGSRKYASMPFFKSTGPESSGIAYFMGEYKAIGIVMPLRVDAKHSVPPEWLMKRFGKPEAAPASENV